MKEIFKSDTELFQFYTILNISVTKITVPAPLTDAATIQELSFWGPDYHIKNE